MLTGGTYNNKVGTWSHDGKRIAFKSDRNGKWGIYVMNADGSTAKLLTEECEEFGHPVRSAVGSFESPWVPNICLSAACWVA